MTHHEGAVTLAFVGYARLDASTEAGEYEDALLPLVGEHGGVVQFRGRRRGDDESLPLEVHVLWFPSRAALTSFLGDPRRQDLATRYGDVFAVRHALEVDVVESVLG